jgi:hypothetical protein
MTQDLRNRYLDGNMHPVDALAFVRKQISEMKKIEDDLKAQIMADKTMRLGDLHEAEVVTVSQNRICREAVRNIVGNLDLVRRVKKYKAIKVTPIEASK